jgi:hypothetical protein
MRAFSCEDAKQACLILRMSTKKQKHQALMFLKGFGYDQCEEDATKGSNPIKPMRKEERR